MIGIPLISDINVRVLNASHDVRRSQASQHASGPGQSDSQPGSVPEAAPNGTRWGDTDEDSPRQKGSEDAPEYPEKHQHEQEFQVSSRLCTPQNHFPTGKCPNMFKLQRILAARTHRVTLQLM